MAVVCSHSHKYSGTSDSGLSEIVKDNLPTRDKEAVLKVFLVLRLHCVCYMHRLFPRFLVMCVGILLHVYTVV